MKEICGNCKYHTFESVDSGYVCANPDSEYCADWTEYNDSCEDFEVKDNV